MRSIFRLPAGLLFAVALLFPLSAHAQHPATPAVRIEALRARAMHEKARLAADAADVEALRHKLGLRTAFTTVRGSFELVRAEGGRPVYLQTLGSAATVFPFYSATTQPSTGATGLNVTAAVWDGGVVRHTHQELTGRVTVQDRTAAVQSHATHVGGVIGGRGVKAPGVAPDVTLVSYDWGRDRSEMTAAAGNGLRLSNHAYGQAYGWVYNPRGDGRWAWLGDTQADSREDHRFGTYDWLAAAWDDIAYNAPHYVIVKAAGNDRGEGPAPGTEHWIVDPVASQWVLSNTARDLDGGADGYNTIIDAGNAKNVITVGAVVDATAASVQSLPVSAWGPTADGRIKPDLTAAGGNVYAAIATTDSSYAAMSGTSMAAAAVTGAVAGLLEIEQRVQPGRALQASTYRALLAHTAREAGAAPGPDYASGWGVLDAEQAAAVLEEGLRGGGRTLLREVDVAMDATTTLHLSTDGTRPLQVTIAWTDPEGIAATSTTAATSLRLVNDLDMWIEDAQANRFEPWVLDPDSPDAPAQRGVNTRDNIEQVLIEAPGIGAYLVHVRFRTQQNAPADAVGAPQTVSIVATGLTAGQEALPVELAHFEGIAGDGGVHLRWSTASETNNAGFGVEHSSDESSTWQELTFVPGHGTSTLAHAYAHTVRDLAPGRHLFRLRQVDYDGAVAYSGIVEIAVALETPFRVTAPTPNPFSEFTGTTLDVARAQQVRAEVYDLMGRRVALLLDGYVAAGQPEKLYIDGSGLAPGLYLLRVTGETFTHTERIVRLR